MEAEKSIVQAISVSQNDMAIRRESFHILLANHAYLLNEMKRSDESVARLQQVWNFKNRIKKTCI